MSNLDGNTAWATVRHAAMRAREHDLRFESTKRHKPYRIKDVRSKNLTIERLGGGEDTIIGERWVRDRINVIKTTGGRIGADCIGGNRAQRAALVFLHPDLDWAADGDTIVVR